MMLWTHAWEQNEVNLQEDGISAGPYPPPTPQIEDVDIEFRSGDPIGAVVFVEMEYDI